MHIKQLLNSKVFMILFIAAAIRLININMPILEGTATRQVQTATISKNFYQEGFNILYPKVDSFGNEPGYYVLEFPLLNLIIALLYKLSGGIHEWMGRLIVILFFLGTTLYLYGITRRLFSERIAFWTIVSFIFFPLSIIYSRTIMPDFVMLFLSLGAVYYLLRFPEDNKKPQFWLSCLFLSLSLLVKPQSFYILLPLVYLIYKKEGWKLIKNYQNWAYFILAFIPAILWYAHAINVHKTFSEEAMVNYTLSNWFNIEIFKDKRLYKYLFDIYRDWILTPIGITLFIGGLFLKTKGKQNVIWVWLISVIVYTIAFITHVIDPYYNLASLPILAIFIGRTFPFILDSQWYLSISKKMKLFLILIISLIIARYAVYAYIVPEGYKYETESGKKIQEITDKNALIVVSTEGGTHALYFCKRKGWGLPLAGSDEEKTKEVIFKLESYISKGADYYMTPCMDDFNKSIYFKQYMDKNYTLVLEEPDKYIIYKLEK